MSTAAHQRGANMSVDSLPSDESLEAAFVGGLIKGAKSLDKAITVISPLCLSNLNYAWIYDCIIQMHGEGTAVNPVTVRRKLSDAPPPTKRHSNPPAPSDSAAANLLAHLESEGVDLSKLIEDDVAAYDSEIPSIALEIDKLYIRRRFILNVYAGAEAMADGHLPVDQIVENFSSQVNDVISYAFRRNIGKASTAAEEAFRAIEARQEQQHNPDAVTTGFSGLDQLIGGFYGSDLVVLAARPSMGKTAVAINIIDHVAGVCQTGTCLVSLEMTCQQVMERSFASVGSVDGRKFRTGAKFTDDEKRRLQTARQIVSGYKLWVDDQPRRNIVQILANIRSLKRQQPNMKLLIVDYIQMVDAEKSWERRDQQVAQISRSLKEIAKELNIVVLALSQLKREVENRDDKRPRMSDLRESGNIEQDADTILFIHRPEYYEPGVQPNMAELIIAKNRNGGTGDIVPLVFKKEYTRFDSILIPGYVK